MSIILAVFSDNAIVRTFMQKMSLQRRKFYRKMILNNEDEQYPNKDN